MYFDKYIKKGMSDDQMKTVADELVEKAFFDAPENYKEDPDYIYQYLEEYKKKIKN